MPVTRVVIVGAGFAGYHAARQLVCSVGDRVEVVVVNATDYFLYVPLLPEVTAGVVDPRRVAVSIASALPGARLVVGTVDDVDFDASTVHYRDPDGVEGTLSYDHLVLTAGSVNKLLPIPGVSEHALGFRNLAEAVYLRDHLLRQLELADATDDPAERAAHLTFAVIGAGYTGTEVAAQGARLLRSLLRRHPRLAGEEPHWLLLDTADRVLPTLAEKLSKVADSVLRELGVDVRMKTSVNQAYADRLELSDGSTVLTPSLIWCVGVRADPLVESIRLPTEQGRITVDRYLRVPTQPKVWSCGDVAAVEDVTRAGQLTPMTAQHAQRQGKRAGANIAAELGHGKAKPYKHHDLGFVVDLGGRQAGRGRSARRAVVRPTGQDGHAWLPFAGDAWQPNTYRDRLGRECTARAARAAAEPGQSVDGLSRTDGRLTDVLRPRLRACGGRPASRDTRLPALRASHRPCGAATAGERRGAGRPGARLHLR